MGSPLMEKKGICSLAYVVSFGDGECRIVIAIQQTTFCLWVSDMLCYARNGHGHGILDKTLYLTLVYYSVISRGTEWIYNTDGI